LMHTQQGSGRGYKSYWGQKVASAQHSMMLVTHMVHGQ
jgi:hypothetical protein